MVIRRDGEMEKEVISEESLICSVSKLVFIFLVFHPLPIEGSPINVFLDEGEKNDLSHTSANLLIVP